MARMKRLTLLSVGIAALAVGCKSKPPPAPPPSQPPAIYTGDRRGDGGLLQNRPTPGAPVKPVKQGTPEENLTLGNPDGAQTSPAASTRYLLVRRQYALSYNDDKRGPNWVSWKLDAEDIGSQPRGNFAPDNELPFSPVTPGDYTGSGYDRGHNCPSKDRSASKEDNDAVFLMSNMTPQMHAMNAGPWERLESYTRHLVQQQGMTCYVICGHVGEIGRTRGGVVVPAVGWKVVVAVQRGQPIDATARVIAVEMPNDDPAIERESWEKYIVTVGELEQHVQLPLLNGLPPEVAAALKTKRDKGGGSFGGDSGTSRRSRRPRGGSFGR